MLIINISAVFHNWYYVLPFFGSSSVNFVTGQLDIAGENYKERAGCVELMNTVQTRVQPKYHIYGHIHEGTIKCACRYYPSWL